MVGPICDRKLNYHGVVHIRTIDEEAIPFLVNGYILKAYKIPLSEEEFVSSISKEVMMIGGVSSSNSLNY